MPAEAAALRAEVVTNTPDISAFRDTWNELFQARRCQPSTSFEWTDAMVRHHVTKEDQFLLVRIARRQHTVCLVPLVGRSMSVLRQPVVVLSPISEWYGTHGDLLCEELDEETAHALVAALPSLGIMWDVFRMSRLPHASPLAGLLAGGAAATGLRYGMRDARAYHLLDLPASFDEYLSGRTAKFRRYLRKVARDLEAAGRVRIEQCVDEESFLQGYEALLQIERTSWKQAHGTAITAVPHQVGFYRDLGRHAAAAGRAYLQILWLDDFPIAHNLGYFLNGCYYYLKSSYHAEYESLSPATFLRTHLMRELVERGTRSVDFLATYEWERQWTQTVAHQDSLVIYNRTARAALIRLVDAFKHKNRSSPLLAGPDA